MRHSCTPLSSGVRTILITTAGTNCDHELARAFQLAGSNVETVHINRLVQNPGILRNFQIMGIPGGFSYGDDIASGKIFANILVDHLREPLGQWMKDGKLIIGICNGFQVLVKAGLLPGNQHTDGAPSQITATLTHNHNGRFEDRWVKLKTYSRRCKWIMPGLELSLPVAHGEGRFVVSQPSVLESLRQSDQIVLRYVDSAGQPTQQFPANPNGSLDAIAGVCDPTGCVLGLMPHPERFISPYHHPYWTRFDEPPVPHGRIFFESAVAWIRQNSAVKLADSTAAVTC